MRYKILLFIVISFANYELSIGALRGPLESNKKQNPDEDTKSYLASYNEEDDETSALKIVQPPDLSKEKERKKETVDLLLLDQAKVLQKMVEELDFIKTSLIDESPTDHSEEELPPIPDSLLHPKELTPEEKEAKEIFDQASQMLNKTRPDKNKAYTLLQEASKKGSQEAKALIAWAKLFGNPLKQDIESAHEMFETLAEIGNPDGHTGLGFLYSIGLSVNVSQARALVHFTFGAIGGNIWSQMIMGYRYWSGITVSPSCEKSLDFYRQVADKVSQGVTFGGGAAIQRIRLLDELENGYSSGILDNDLIEYYQLLAEKGDIQAQVRLGELHYQGEDVDLDPQALHHFIRATSKLVGLGQLHYQGGRGVDLDYQKALHYFTQAANAGNAVAMAYLGKIYLDGSDEINADNFTAFKYFKKASDLNNPVGLSGLGLMYLYGRGVERDYVKAHKYFLAAADQGWVDGQLQLGNMYLNGLGMRKDYKLANKYFSLASQSGHVLAYYNLGQMHAQGTGMLRSCPTAVELFKNVAERGRWGELLMQAHTDYRDGHYNEAFVQYALLAELGYEVAQSNAAFLLDRGEVPMLSGEEALVRGLLYWGRAATQGYSAAQVKMGDYHYYGFGTPVDYEAAATHYRLASEQQHNAQAMFNLGYMHEQGLGMSRDMHLAKRLYDLAAETSSDAKVPVSLALIKLNFLFGMEILQQSRIYQIMDLSELFSSYWDLYLLTILSMILSTIIYLRWQHIRV